MNHRQNHDEHIPLDDGSRALAERLDALGRADADGAPPGLESRLLDAVSGVYAPGPLAIDRARTPWWRGAPLRAAAAIALLGAGAALIYSLPGPPPPHAGGGVVSVAMAEDRIEGLLAVLGERDGFDDQVASLELWADAIGSDGAGVWIGSDLGDTHFNGGAF